MSELRFPINERDHIVGPDDAPVTLVEYGDYQCPHCQAAWPQVELILRHFGDELRYAYRHFPISTAHPMAKPAAETAEFAGAHGLFWEAHSAIYANGSQLSGSTLAAIVSGLGLDVADLQDALDQGACSSKIEFDFASGIRSGVNGTPCFFVNGKRHDGAYDAVSLSAAIDAARRDGASNHVRIPLA
ncbi:disulfide bond formation protein DsbA [Sphingobium sp. 22B]|nr:disulfide bond formation protein DsbA [Sphingobium sp. AM]KYC31143.1 disulfide bond formation protein DsbA [Sphingobium sp. 22B]OAP31145.1 disulfide bond formation protein DsbA [Sphingobium sp. 20006FA]